VHAQTGLPGWRVLESTGGRHGDGGRVPSVAGGECAPTVRAMEAKLALSVCYVLFGTRPVIRT
jgi:hypothetical protein